MSKKGGSKHYVRMRASKNLGVIERKSTKWLLSSAPGPHKKEESISVGVLLRDVLSKVDNIREAKKMLIAGNVLVDGKKVKESKRPIGLMDIIELPAEAKHFRMTLQGARMVPKSIPADAAKKKYLKVTGKHTVSGNKISITFHDGRNYLGDKHINTGDTCIFSVPEFKLANHIKFAPGAVCLVVKGKHKGEVAKLEKLIERPGSHDTEALLSSPSGEFVTVAKYLFVVDENF